VRREQDGSGYINTIGRGDKFRGRGIGDILIAQALHYLAELGATSARLAVVVTNISALALYERHGFKAIKSLEVVSKALIGMW
jgi:ribosomal protein S18 acetylase RimI-like enzyme